MNRKLLGGLAVLVVAFAAVWFFFLRKGDDEPAAKKPDTTARTGDIVAPKPAEKPKDAPRAPAGMAPRWTLDTDPAGPLVLEGQVQNADGEGVGGATVRLGSVPPRTTTTEADGTFTFDKLVGRTYYLTASSGKMVGGPVSYKLTEKSDPIVIRLGDGASVVVTVTDEAKKPIAGATVKQGEDVKATTDDKGVATLEPVRPGWVGVSAQAEGYAEAQGFTTIGTGGVAGTIEITMRKGYAISGRVVDERGKPIAKAKVSASSGRWWMGDGDGGSDGGADDTSVTDAKGAFQMKALPSGTVTLTAVDGEHAPGSSSPITIGDRPVTGITITMKDGAVLAGKVVDAQNAPVAYATVRVAGKGQDAWQQTARQATTDQAGAFELRGLARTAIQARAESDTAASKIADVDLAEKDKVTDLVLTLDVTGRISGHVVDELGKPVTEVQVNAFPDILAGGPSESLALAGMSSATTDGEGAFAIVGLADGAYRLWAARALTAFDWGQHGTSAKTGDKDVKIVLPAPGSLKGKLVLKGASTPPVPAFVQIGQRPPTPVRPDGTFFFREVPAGTSDVTFRGPQFAELIRRDVKIEPGKETDLGAVEVVRGRRLTGKVTDRNGAVAGAKVKVGQSLFSAEGAEAQMENLEAMYGTRQSETDQNGEFTISGIPEKETTAVATHPERGASTTIAIPAGTDDPPPVSFALRGFGSIVGKVTMKGKPVGKVTVGWSIKGGGAAATFTQTTEDGSYTMSKVPEGAVVVQAMQQQMMEMRSASANAVVHAGKQTTVNIDIPVGELDLTVTVKPKAGAQVDAAQVFLFRGTVSFSNGKQITDGFMQGNAQGMKFWFGAQAPMPKFEELVAGDYSVCTIPITGSLQDPTFQQRLQENVAALEVYCRAVKMTPSPKSQSLVHEVPAMTPLPPP